jgi:hypothetical protein
MKYHPFAEAWPLLEGPKFDKLVADIKAHGLHYPIALYQEMILDGRNRYRACVEAGVKPRYEQSKAKNDHDALIMSASMNEHRRHLTEDQLAMVASRLANMPRGGYTNTSKAKIQIRTSNPENKLITIDEAAEAVGVNSRKVDEARAIQKYAPELEKEVINKKLSISAAANEARSRKKAKNAAKKTVAEIKAIQAKERADKPQRVLTKEMVDPEWTGTEFEFTIEYGHVWTKTAQERATSHFGLYAISMGHLAKTAKAQPWPKITPRLVEWLRKPKHTDIEKMRESLTVLENYVATGRNLLRRAEETIVESQVA